MDCESTASVMQSYYQSIQLAEYFPGHGPQLSLHRSMDTGTEGGWKRALLLRSDV